MRGWFLFYHHDNSSFKATPAIYSSRRPAPAIHSPLPLSPSTAHQRPPPSCRPSHHPQPPRRHQSQRACRTPEGTAGPTSRGRCTCHPACGLRATPACRMRGRCRPTLQARHRGGGRRSVGLGWGQGLGLGLGWHEVDNNRLLDWGWGWGESD